MRTSLTILDSTCRRLVLLADMAFLLAAGGCSLERNEAEGDPNKALGEYRVSISKSAVALTAEKRDDEVTVSVTCVILDGSLTPPVINPGWSVKNPREYLVQAEVVHPGQTPSPAILRINEIGLGTGLLEGIRTLADNPLLGAQNTVLVEFFPKNVPLGFSVTGQRCVTVQFPLPPGPDVRQPTPALERKLTIEPNPVTMPANGTSPTTRNVTIVYKGQVTFLESISLSGADAAKFRVEPPLLPLATDTISAVRVPVTFLGLTDANDPKTYTAEITAATLNGTSRMVQVSAHR